MPNLGPEFIFKALAGIALLIDRAVCRVRVKRAATASEILPSPHYLAFYYDYY